MVDNDEIVDAIIVDDADCPHDLVIAGICLKCEQKVAVLAVTRMADIVDKRQLWKGRGI